MTGAVAALAASELRPLLQCCKCRHPADDEEDQIVAVREKINARSILRARAPYIPAGQEEKVLARFDAQLGEIGWHAVQIDPEIDSQSKAHAQAIIEIAQANGLKSPRIIELGAYAHYSAHLAATRLNGSAVSHDISAASLRTAQARAAETGCCAPHTAVAGDFHNLPFADNSFDLTFIASAVHHTWRPWEVLSEMVRITRPGGIIHLHNEPVARLASMYQFRSNRNESHTRYEAALFDSGLSFTVMSPFAGSRAEQLFGMVENEHIPVEVYEQAFAGCRRILWQLDTGALHKAFEVWLETKPSASEIALMLREKIGAAAKLFSEKDRAAGFSVPGDDEIWPLAYRIERLMRERDSAANLERENARIFGAALRVTVAKRGDGSVIASGLKRLLGRDPGIEFRRALRSVEAVLIDDTENDLVDFENIMPPLVEGLFGPHWHLNREGNGSLAYCNLTADNALPLPFDRDGFLVLRMFSVELEAPHFVSVTVNGEQRYCHHAAASESHLAKVFVRSGDRVVVHLHDEYGDPVATQLATRIRPGFVALK